MTSGAHADLQGDADRAAPRIAGRIFTVPAGVNFLAAVARAILAGDLPAPGGEPPERLDLPAWTVLLPTRRAARALGEGFLAASGGAAMLLPAIRPIAEADEDLDLVERVAGLVGGDARLDLPPAIDPLARQLLLSRLVLAWSDATRRGSEAAGSERGLAPVGGAGTPAQALALAKALARLMDEVETEGVTLDGLAGLVPAELSEHWQQTLDFLSILTAHWPRHLADLGLVSPAGRRNLALEAEARRIAARPLAHPVVVAGVTGSVPATVGLMRAVLGDPKGAIVLPALDLELDDATWQRLVDHPEHPQHGFRLLLHALGADRRQVVPLPGSAPPSALAYRARFVEEALRPAGTLEHWRAFVAAFGPARAADALAGVDLVEAQSDEEEAEVVALLMREAAETPGRTAALVSPNRLLARRVAVRLAAWGIRVDDSAGRPLAKTMPGTFLDLVTAALASDFAPVDVVALLKHPLTRLGLDAGTIRRRARRLELAVFRKPYLGRGLAGVASAVAVQVLEPTEKRDIADLVARLEAAFRPLAELAETGERMPLGSLVARHAAVAEAIATPDAGGDDPGLWREPAGEAAAALVGTLTAPGLPELGLGARDYPDVWRALVAPETVRTRVPVHPRLFVWGPYEARLQRPDLVILGSLVEGTWPKAADPGPWLNRGMRKQLGLPVPEVETGRAAHDLVGLLGAGRVVLTRAAKSGSAPTVRSRWVERVLALAESLGSREALRPAQPWLDWARAKSRVEPAPPIRPPSPRPALDLRPRRATVSDVETWIRNPYALYAQRILRLKPLPRLGAEPGPVERGIMLHQALAEFAREHPGSLPADVAAQVMGFANEVVREMTGVPSVAAFWLPRLERFAEWFAETEPARRANGVSTRVEIDGALEIEAPCGTFTLAARADRIDLVGGAARIFDYKTGKPPSWKQVEAGFRPQLPLEAAMLAAGAFADVPAIPVESLGFIGASGGEPAGIDSRKAGDRAAIAAIAEAAIAGLRKLVAEYDTAAKDYAVLRRPNMNYDYDDYAHLARIDEWRGQQGGEGA